VITNIMETMEKVNRPKILLTRFLSKRPMK